MRHPLDHCVNSTRHTLGLADVRCFSGKLVEPLNYKYLHTPSILPCVCFVSFCEFSKLTVRRFLKFRLKEVTSLYLTCFYIVMLPKCCLVLVVVLVLVVL